MEEALARTGYSRFPVADVDGRGKRITGDALRPVSEATTVRVSRGKVLVTDGPFTETKEWIAGFDILECDDLDEAIAIAARHGAAIGAKPVAVAPTPAK